MYFNFARRFIGKTTKRHFLKLVSDAYDHPNRASHLRIREVARSWYGTTRVTTIRRRWSELFIDLVYHAQLELFRHGVDRELGMSPIGFEDLVLSCRSSDANSSVVYLYGFSDNLTYFPLYRSCVRPGSVALDVGANLGIHSLVLSRCVGERGRVIAYEPSIAIHDRLVRNIETNGATNIIPRRLGLWERSGSAGFDARVSEFNIGKGTINAGATAQVPVTTLDEDEEVRGCGGNIDLIKIDVEGAELSVIKGAGRTLSKHRPAIITEFNPGHYSLESLLNHIPYDCRCYRVPYTFRESLTPINGVGLNRRADVLIIPSEKPAPTLSQDQLKKA